mgnify:CR=1 FL=1
MQANTPLHSTVVLLKVAAKFIAFKLKETLHSTVVLLKVEWLDSFSEFPLTLHSTVVLLKVKEVHAGRSRFGLYILL